MIGTTVSHYKVLEKIGEGGMGEVYLADDTKLHRQVALKFLPEELTRDEERKQRFIQEARSAAGIQHPHIAAIYDVDEVDGRTFIAMEYVPGESLRDVIRSEELSFRRSLELGLQIAEGLAKAHEKGVVHRDVKPENVLISEDGYAKIIDFGLAKLVEQTTTGAESVNPEEAETLLRTREGTVMGTVAYMSPEQALGEKLDARTDIFSLGAVLYEMLSGASPFQRKSAVGTLSALLKESPPELTLPEATPPKGLQQVLAKALAKERSERYPTMKELARELNALLDHAADRSQPVFPAGFLDGTRKKLWAAATLGVVTLLSTVLYLSFRGTYTVGMGASGRPAIAVAYFESMTGDEEIRWLSRGLPNMLVTDLAQTPGLDVVSSHRLQEMLEQVGEEDLENIDKSLVADVARRAGAGALVVGSIFKSGDEIRIDVQVEDVGTGTVLSAESVRGEDVFPMVDELSGRIRASLEVGDRPEVRPITEVTTTSLEAYRLYSEGLEAARNTRYRDARRLLEQAIEIDSNFAMAYAELSSVTGAVVEPELSDQYFEKALELQDNLPERQRLRLQAQEAQRQKNFEKAHKIYETLISRYPDEEDAYVSMAGLDLVYLDNLDRALATLERGVEAVPSWGPLRNQLGYALLGAGRYTEAIREFENYSSLSPREPNPYDSLGDAYLAMGEPEKALGQFTRALEVDPTYVGSRAGRALAYGMLGRYDEALEENDAVRRFLTPQGVNLGPYHSLQAFLLSRVGRYQEAEHHLREARQAVEAWEDEWYLWACELQAGRLALERGDYSRALEHAERLQNLLSGVPVQPQRTFAVGAAHFLAGVAEARAGNVEAARFHLAAQEELDLSGDQRRWWHGVLAGEIALAEGDLAAAEAAFVDSERGSKMGVPRFWVYQDGRFRDGPARVMKARGDLAGAVELYRTLNTPRVDGKWGAMLEPRFVLKTARLLDQMGDKEGARAEYQRFLELWKNADEGLLELAEARSYVRDE